MTDPSPAGPAGREPSAAELRALADHAAQRLALYRRRILLGRGDPRRLAELQRVADGATDRARRREHPTSPSTTSPQESP